MDVLVTAGATRNPIDAMRLITSGSSGRTGLGLAEAWRERGLAVAVLGSEEARLRAGDLPVETFGSTRDLMARMERWVRAHPQGAVVHAAAVGDYEAAHPEAGKIPSGQDELVLKLARTPKIADHVRGWGLQGPYVTFKAAAPGTEPATLARLAQAQRLRTGCDLVFANVLGHLGRDVLLVDEAVRAFPQRQDAVRALVDWLVQRAGASG